MAVDGKYGRVTLEHGDIGEDEQVVVFRAQDSLLPKVLAWWQENEARMLDRDLVDDIAGVQNELTDAIRVLEDLKDKARFRLLLESARTQAAIEETIERLQSAHASLQDVTGTLVNADSVRDGAAQEPNKARPAADTGPQTSGSAPPWLPLYVHVGPDPVTTEWTKVSGVAWPSRSPLYTFSGDTPGGRPWGVSSGWQHYTGSVDYWQMGQAGDVADSAREQAASVPLEVSGLYEIRRLGGGNIVLSVRGCRAHTLNRDDAQLLGAALQQVASAPADRPHVCSPAGYCPPTDEAKPAADTKANLMALALATDDTTKKEELQSVLDQLTWVELASRADAHRQLDAVLDAFARAFGHKHVGEPYMGGG